MPKKTEGDPIAQRLDAILEVMQNVLIIQGANAKMSKAEVRKILGVGADRVSSVWRYLNVEQ